MTVQSIYRPGLFAGKVALVTGGGTGIGFAIAHELAVLGATVVIAARTLDRLDEAARRIRDEGHDAHAITMNVRDEGSVREGIADVVRRFGRLDLLVNNAGGQFPSPAGQIRKKGWDAVLETNLTGTFLCCREAFAASMEERGGVIVNIIADMWSGFPGMAHTGAARAGVDNLTKSLSLEWAHRGVRVNAVAPGIILSSGIDNYDPFFQDIFLKMKDEIPARRLGTEEEVASAVLYLLSPAAAFVTGATLRVDGGGSLWRTRWEIPDHDRLPPWGTVRTFERKK